MASQNLILNILPFTHPVKSKEFHFITEKKEGYYSIKKEELPQHLLAKFSQEKLATLYRLYTNFHPQEDPILNTEINFLQSPNIAKHYYSFLIHNYFKNIAKITNSNFIKDNELWFLNKDFTNQDFNAYSVFTIKVNINKITDSPEILISYGGISKVSTKNVTQLNCDTHLYNWVVYQNNLYKHDHLPKEALYKLEEVYPKMRYELYAPMGLKFVPHKDDYKYTTYYKNVNGFYRKYVNVDAFKQIIPLSTNQLFQVDNLKIKNTTPGSNLLLFGNDKPNIKPYDGIKLNGPYELPQNKHIKFIYVYYQNDEADLHNLQQWFKGLKTGFSGLKQFARINYTEDTANNIMFTNLSNPIEEVRNFLSTHSLDANSIYIAIYLSPFEKDEKDPQKKQVYFQIKQELLRYKVTSQVVVKSKLYLKTFNFHLPPIAIAIVAKLNGVPWRLQRDENKELIVGVGAFKNQEIGEKYIGSAFCFSNDGHFKGFECHSANDTDLLAGSIAKAIRTYRSTNNKIERLVIHFYKSMSYKELKPIQDELDKIEEDIPIIIVTINKTESKDYVIFDTNYKNYMPISGTFISIGDDEYLLCNNTRYPDAEPTTKEGFPFPIKLKMQSNKENIINNEQTINDLIDQVYQFSRMYWKSVTQHNIPVTILYPEMVAGIYPFLDNKNIPPYGFQNLWFL